MTVVYPPGLADSDHGDRSDAGHVVAYARISCAGRVVRLPNLQARRNAMRVHDASDLTIGTALHGLVSPPTAEA